MSYTADPVADALDYDDRQEAAAERHEAALMQFQEEIAEGFKAFKPLPFVQAFSSITKLRYMPFDEAASDLIANDKIWEKFLVALKTSECPKVKAVLDAMESHYTFMWADDCAGSV